jgi:hypothetical protein
MKPVTQTILADEDNPMRGNCFAACLASLLELEIDQVPHVMEHDDWRELTNEWLAPMNLGTVEVVIDTEVVCLYPLPVGMLLIVTGKTNRHPTRLHAVIGRTIYGGVQWEYLHDPHPDGTFLLEASHLMWLVPLNPKESYGTRETVQGEESGQRPASGARTAKAAERALGPAHEVRLR